MKQKYAVMFECSRFLRVEVEALTREEAVDLANELEEMDGEIIQCKYWLANVKELTLHASSPIVCLENTSS